MSSQRLINIGGDSNDLNYRYKMPPLQTKIEGRGNGIKTVILNIVDVCKHLKSHPEYATKFFGVEFGALSKFDIKRSVGIVNGAHQASDMQEHLNKFISEFILCPRCQLPEISIKVSTKKQQLGAQCASCGYRGILPSRHRLSTYIINHPIKNKGKSGESKKSDRQNRRQKKQNIVDENADVDQNSNDNKQNDIQDIMNDTNDTTKPMSNAETEEGVQSLGGADDNIWSVGCDIQSITERRQMEMRAMSETNQKKRKIKNSGQNINDLGEVVILRSFMNDATRSVEEIWHEMDRLQRAHDLTDIKRIKVLFEAIFDFDNIENFIPTIEKSAKLLKRFVSSEKDFQIFIGCIEEALAIRQPRLLTPLRVAKIIEVLYDKEICSEEQLLSWYDSPPDSSWIVSKEEAAEVRSYSKPFIDWLRNAESENDDDDN